MKDANQIAKEAAQIRQLFDDALQAHARLSLAYGELRALPEPPDPPDSQYTSLETYLLFVEASLAERLQATSLQVACAKAQRAVDRAACALWEFLPERIWFKHGSAAIALFAPTHDDKPPALAITAWHDDLVDLRTIP